MARLVVLVILSPILLSGDLGCLAFQHSASGGRLLQGYHSSTVTEAHQGRDVIEEMAVSDGNVISRRSMLVSVSAASLLTANVRPSLAVVATKSTARVESWPGIEALEPLYEFKLSIDAVVTGVQDPKNWPYIQKRLEAFFGGFIVNEKNYYMGVGLQYMNEMKYDPAELPNYVLLDKEARFDALDNTMKNLEGLKKALAAGGSTDGDAAAVDELAKSCQRSLQTFFDMIPEQDVKAVGELFEHVKKADVNRDGRLSDDEVIYLSPVEQEIWKRRTIKFG